MKLDNLSRQATAWGSFDIDNIKNMHPKAVALFPENRVRATRGLLLTAGMYLMMISTWLRQKVDYLRFIVGIFDAIEKAKRWDEFIIESAPGQTPRKKRTRYRNSIISLACTILWRVPNPTWKTIEDLRGEFYMENIPEMALKA